MVTLTAGERTELARVELVWFLVSWPVREEPVLEFLSTPAPIRREPSDSVDNRRT